MFTSAVFGHRRDTPAAANARDIHHCGPPAIASRLETARQVRLTDANHLCRSKEVHFQHLPHDFFGGGAELAETTYPRTVNEHIQLPETLHRLRNDPNPVFQLREVAGKGFRKHARGTHFIHDLRKIVGRACRQGEGGTEFREPFRSPAADSSRSSRQQHNPSAHIPAHTSPSSTRPIWQNKSIRAF